MHAVAHLPINLQQHVAFVLLLLLLCRPSLCLIRKRACLLALLLCVCAVFPSSGPQIKCGYIS